MVVPCSEVAMSDAEKERDARCKAMLNKLISEVKKQTLKMEDLVVCMNELAVDLKAIVQPRGGNRSCLAVVCSRTDAHLCPHCGPCCGGSYSTRRSRPCLRVAHQVFDGSCRRRHRLADVCIHAGHDPGSPSTAALLIDAIISLELSVAIILVCDGTSVLTSTPNDAAFHSIDLGDEHVPKLCRCQLGARKLFDGMPIRNTVVFVATTDEVG